MPIFTEQTGPDTFDVTIRDAAGERRLGVALTDTLLKELTGGRRTKEACVRAAVQFLIDREKVRPVPRRFDVAMIETAFPEFRREIGPYLNV